MIPEVTHTAIDHRFVEQGCRGCGPGCILVAEECRCGLGRRLRILDGKVRAVDVRIRGGHWVDVRDFLAVADGVPYLLCPRCSGSGCDTCRHLGVLERIPPRPGRQGTGASTSNGVKR
jgi:hypothetical protein